MAGINHDKSTECTNVVWAYQAGCRMLNVYIYFEKLINEETSVLLPLSVLSGFGGISAVGQTLSKDRCSNKYSNNSDSLLSYRDSWNYKFRKILQLMLVFSSMELNSCLSAFLPQGSQKWWIFVMEWNLECVCTCMCVSILKGCFSPQSYESFLIHIPNKFVSVKFFSPPFRNKQSLNRRRKSHISFMPQPFTPTVRGCGTKQI